LCVTTTSSWPWIDRRVSGLQPATNRPIKTRFPYGSPKRLALLQTSKSLTHYTKGTPSPLRALTACTHPVSGSISLPSPGFFSPFPHGTGSLSVGNEYLALEDGPPMFRQGFTCLALLDFISCAFSHTGLSPTMAGLSRTVLLKHKKLKGYSAFARHYLRNLG
jgi:hypothetical protein